MFSTRGLFLIAGAAGLLAGFSLSQHRQRERHRVASRAKPEPVQTWEGEGGAVPLHTGRTAQQVTPTTSASRASDHEHPSDGPRYEQGGAPH
jgi:hypothetical protein